MHRQVLEVSTHHIELTLSEDFIVLDYLRLLVTLHHFHSVRNKLGSADSKGLLKHLQIKHLL